MSSKPAIILVTGSSGCLGQHIVKLLQDYDDNVKEIRLYDRRPFYNKIGIDRNNKVIEHFGDINNPRYLLPAVEGVDCVFHCAAIVDTRMIPEEKSMELNNIQGTQSVIDACLQMNVPTLVFASTSAVCCGSEDIYFKSEKFIPKPTKFVLGKYAETKSIAEDLILKANGKKCSDGQTTLKTVSLRPVPFYGAADIHFVPTFLRYTKHTGGFYHRIWSRDQRLQICYVGNVAWAFLKAKDKLAIDNSIAGEVFFINDNTLPVDIHKNMDPFIKSRDFDVHCFFYPYWLAWIILSLITFCVRFINVFYKYELDVPSVSQLKYVCSCFIFNRCKSANLFGYQPIFTPEEAKRCSVLYYGTMRLE